MICRLLYFSRDLPNATISTSFAAHLQSVATRTIPDGMPWNFVHSILYILYWCSSHYELEFYLSDFSVFYALTTGFYCDWTPPVQARTCLVPWKNSYGLFSMKDWCTNFSKAREVICRCRNTFISIVMAVQEEFAGVMLLYYVFTHLRDLEIRHTSFTECGIDVLAISEDPQQFACSRFLSYCCATVTISCMR